MTTPSQSFHEPLRATLIRNCLIAIATGSVLALASARSPHPVRWMVALIVMLFPSFGGHLLEVWYLNWLRPRLSTHRAVQRAARLGTWFIGGCALGVAMVLTARALDSTRLARWPAWWLTGVAFIGIELVAHAGVQIRGQPNFFNGRG